MTAKAQERDEGLRGQKGGDVYLYVRQVEAAGAGKRVLRAGQRRGRGVAPCPAGWGFEDCMFVNGTSSELTISEIRVGNNVMPAQVNEPQGGIRVKLSFERLKLLPGEATKLSVCLNTEPRQIEFTEFGFQAGGSNYFVNFNVKGLPSSSKKDAGLVFKSFDVDTDNRVLTFARP